MNSNNPKDFVANYELNDYRYSDFWLGREYEHEAEVLLLKNLFLRFLPDLKSREIVDLGGAYGRLSPLYANTAKGIILADYSTNELLEATGRVVQTNYRNKVSFIALNAYKMPFPSASVGSLLSVRVMHHLKEMPLFITELERVLAPGGVAIIEFANKNHILAIIRHLLRFDFKYLRQKVLQVSHKAKDSQGIKEGQVSIMYNFAPGFMKELSREVGLKVEGMFACSFLRSGFLKKLFSTEKLLSIEKILQKMFGKVLLTPSVFIVVRKEGTFMAGASPLSRRVVCPICQMIVKEDGGDLLCENGHCFTQSKLGIIDLRDPRPEEIDF